MTDTEADAAALTWESFYAGVAAWVNELSGRIAGRFGLEREDVAQELLARLWTVFPNYTPARSRPTTFVAVVARSLAGHLAVRHGAAKRTGTTVSISADDPDLWALPDPDAADPAGALDLDDDAAALRAAVARLPERLRRVIEARYGLADGDRLTLRQIAAEMGVSAERVRVLESDALRVLAGAFGADPDRATPAKTKRRRRAAATT